MRCSFFLFGFAGPLLALAAASCSASTDSRGGSTGTTSGGGTTTSTSSSGTGGTGGVGGAGQGGGGAGQGGGGSGQGGGGAGQGGASAGVTADLVSMDFYVDCMPIVAPDPVNGSFIAKYTNSGASNGKATITTATLTFENANQTLAWPVPVLPADSGNLAPGFSGQVAHVKQDNGGGTGSPCNFCGGTWSLAVTWDVGGGQTAMSTLDGGAVGCAF